MNNIMIITVDVGGTKTLIASFDKSGTRGPELRFETPKNEAAFLERLVTTIQAVYPDNAKMDAISVALPGMFSQPGMLDYAPNLGWRHINIQKQLNAHFTCPIFVENDANLAGLAEARALKVTPPLCIYVTVSTGIGTGIITNGQITPELSQSEGGHMVLEYDGVLRSWESFASGNSIHLTYGKYGYEITSKRTWTEIADKISRGLLALIPLLQPDVIIIGGSIGTHFEHYGITLRRILEQKLEKTNISVPTIKQAAHPQEAVIYGCYYYAVDHLTR
ncbi:MAG: ROK family protein [Microcoleus sp.]